MIRFDGLQSLRNFKRAQRSLWRQIDFRPPLAAGGIMLLVILATFMADMPWLSIIPILGYLFSSGQQGYSQPSSPLLIATAITSPALLLDIMLALFHSDGQVATIWLAITLTILLLSTIGAFAGMWLHSTQQKL